MWPGLVLATSELVASLRAVAHPTSYQHSSPASPRTCHTWHTSRRARLARPVNVPHSAPSCRPGPLPTLPTLPLDAPRTRPRRHAHSRARGMRQSLTDVDGPVAAAAVLADLPGTHRQTNGARCSHAGVLWRSGAKMCNALRLCKRNARGEGKSADAHISRREKPGAREPPFAEVRKGRKAAPQAHRPSARGSARRSLVSSIPDP